jgi:hypothetical protein
MNSLYHCRAMRLFIALFFLLACHSSAHAQAYRMMAPPVPIIDQPGATLTQVIDTMRADANPADTGEGGIFDEIESFQTFWRGRVAVNDSSGHNMFDRYLSALRGAAIAGEASPCATSGVYSGAWNKQKLFIGIHFAADLPELQINQTPR